MKKQCAEYKVSSVEVQKISNMFKTEVDTEKDKAEVEAYLLLIFLNC